MLLGLLDVNVHDAGANSHSEMIEMAVISETLEQLQKIGGSGWLCPECKQWVPYNLKHACPANPMVRITSLEKEVEAVKERLSKLELIPKTLESSTKPIRIRIEANDD